MGSCCDCSNFTIFGSWHDTTEELISDKSRIVYVMLWRIQRISMKVRRIENLWLEDFHFMKNFIKLDFISPSLRVIISRYILKLNDRIDSRDCL